MCKIQTTAVLIGACWQARSCKATLSTSCQQLGNERQRQGAAVSHMLTSCDRQLRSISRMASSANMQRMRQSWASNLRGLWSSRHLQAIRELEPKKSQRMWVTPLSSAGRLHGEHSRKRLPAGLGEQKRRCSACGMCTLYAQLSQIACLA